MSPALLVFFLVGTVAVAASILVVAMRNPVHSALFLLLTFLCVAVLFVMKGAEFVGAVQVLVYAGGIMVLFLFVVMLINVRHLPDERVLSSFWKGGVLVGLSVLLLFVNVVRRVHNPDGSITRKHIVRYARIPDGGGNSEAVGLALYRDFLVPFEIAS